MTTLQKNDYVRHTDVEQVLTVIGPSGDGRTLCYFYEGNTRRERDFPTSELEKVSARPGME